MAVKLGGGTGVGTELPVLRQLLKPGLQEQKPPLAVPQWANHCPSQDPFSEQVGEPACHPRLAGDSGSGDCGRLGIGGPNSDLTSIIFKTCQRKGIFLTLVPCRCLEGAEKGRRWVEDWERSRSAGLGLPREAEQPQRT